MSENLTGTVALVTGASSGMGRATALRLADAGAAVALVARRKDRLDELATEVRATGGTALPIATDVTDATAASAAVEQAVGELGRLDTLVNAAGVMLIGRSEEAPLSEWDRMVDVNLRGLLYVTKAALPHLLAAVETSPRKVADVVNISSTSGRVAVPTVAVYAATKFAVTAATEAWRQEYAKRHLRFSAVEPGRTDSELWAQKDGQDQTYLALFGQIEHLRADDIAEVIATIVTSPRRVAFNEILVRPTDEQA